MCMPSIHGDQKGILDTLELELQTMEPAHSAYLTEGKQPGFVG